MSADDACMHCNRQQSDHRLANYADGPHIGPTFLVCPTSTFVLRPSESSRLVVLEFKLKKARETLIALGHDPDA